MENNDLTKALMKRYDIPEFQDGGALMRAQTGAAVTPEEMTQLWNWSQPSKVCRYKNLNLKIPTKLKH